MTGTAATESTEFESIYKFKVTIVPTNKPMIRKGESDAIFRATIGKWQAVVVEISRMNKTENVEREEKIVAQSGHLGAVTIATNMAGRGTGIILGANAEFIARLKLRKMLMPRLGLLVGFTRGQNVMSHESRRIDNQVLNSQRDRVYTERRRALMSDNLLSLVIEYAELTMDDILEVKLILVPVLQRKAGFSKSSLQNFNNLLRSQFSSYEELQDYLHLRGHEAYLQKKDMVEKQAEGLMKEAERFLILSNIDRLWKEHLQALKFVQQAFIIWQFQPMMVKKDQKEKSDKLVTNGSCDQKPDPVGAVESSSSAASSQASA
ncbi:hypothetical protein CRYUN_Cryun20dG0046400 [Craigia yunnanensis]